ncbi:WecB/TagA/CpsF family glycosyltransferase [Kocuria palustris]|uniref:WecB/TagA/CpsF family glycosyltransferase n=1 Tax=Kocuria palustris TaxID=71999 RepID=UPI00195DB2BB|nr:WecB/TagA/CpsF family glycosyltransferase [Kocuria palustris]MBM7822378.1 exopolysaccharide biosynthesis WecB/TagA/CpsF family protein [Kocuria palustris]
MTSASSTAERADAREDAASAALDQQRSAHTPVQDSPGARRSQRRPCDEVDWLIIHQFDAARASPGGIDTVIRGILRHLDPAISVAVVGVDTTAGGDPERIGRWETHDFGGRRIRFLPVVSLDPADQARRMPHTLRLVAGVLRHRKALPPARRMQCHRMDTALTLSTLLRIPLAYVIHTQVSGSTGKSSDSFWRFAGQIHPRLEDLVIRRAVDVRVFSPARLEAVRRVAPRARAATTWWDPELVEQARREAPERDPHRLVWIGRIEKLKAPEFAVEAFAELVREDPETPWSLHFYGPGTESDALAQRIQHLPREVAGRITIHGRVEPQEVARVQASSGAFLMTTYPGYEGFPTVIVESLAAGLPVISTEGADPAGLVQDGRTGFTSSRDPREFAARIRDCLELDRDSLRTAVAALSAPAVVERLMPRPEPLEPSFRPSFQVLGDRLLLDGMEFMVGTEGQVDDELDRLAHSDRPELVVTANVDHVLTLRTSSALLAAYRTASMRLVDGMPLVGLARLLGLAQAERHTGADLLPHTAAVSAARGWRIVITGGADDVAAAAVERLRREHPGADLHHVPFPYMRGVNDPLSQEVIDRLAQLDPALVFLCLGSPKQEAWFEHWRQQLPPAVFVGAGAAVDFAAGTRRRAPRVLQMIGGEWTWRLVQEPRRMASRYLGRGPRFLGVIARSVLSERLRLRR